VSARMKTGNLQIVKMDLHRNFQRGGSAVRRLRGAGFGMGFTAPVYVYK
jgi:hypothetical protein